MNVKQIETCITEYGDDIYRFCCYLTQSKDLADDLYQDCFLAALEKEITVDEKKTKNFLMGIAANQWKNQWRKNKRRQKMMVQTEYKEEYKTKNGLSANIFSFGGEYIAQVVKDNVEYTFEMCSSGSTSDTKLQEFKSFLDSLY